MKDDDKKPLDNNAVNQKKNRLAEKTGRREKPEFQKTGPSVKAKQPSCLRRKRAVFCARMSVTK